jgi:hypothetical protein
MMQTDDHVCHPLDPVLFRELVALATLGDDIVRGPGRDTVLAKYLSADAAGGEPK